MFGLTAIGGGVAALMLAGGFIEWNLWALREGTIQSRLGHIQVVRPGYLGAGAADPQAFLLPATDSLRQEMEALPHVRIATPRLSFAGLISHGETTVSFIGEGVVPEREREIARYLSFGEGRGLATDEPNSIILGKGLATNLGVKSGDTVVLLVNLPQGGIAATEAKVRDTFFTSSKAYDDAAVRVPIEMARKLMRTKGAHRWVILLDDTRNTDVTLATLRSKYGRGSERLEFVPWHEQADYYAKVKTLYRAQVNVLQAIIALIITVSISNTLGMTVIERTSEIGTVMALGSSRRYVIVMFILEGVWIGLLGAAGGVVLGALLASLVSAVGIPMPPSPGMDFTYIGRILLTSPLVIASAAIAFAAASVGSLYPAWVASRMPIVDALRHSR